MDECIVATSINMSCSKDLFSVCVFWKVYWFILNLLYVTCYETELTFINKAKLKLNYENLLLYYIIIELAYNLLFNNFLILVIQKLLIFLTLKNIYKFTKQFLFNI